MFRDEKKPGHKQSINVLITDGGLGDLICTIPALQYMIRTQTWINPLIWVPDYMLDFTKHFLPKETTVRNYSQAKKKFNDKLTGVTTRWIPNRTAMRTHPVDYAYRCLLDRYPYNQEERSYPRIRSEEIDISKFNLPENYVVIVATAAEKVKTMPGETMNKIIDYIKLKGYEVVFVGQEKIDNGVTVREISTPAINLSLGLNLVNKTSLLELAAVIDKASLFIGMDGGPVHIAGFTKVPMVVGYTFASPDHLVPIRDGMNWMVRPVIPDVACRFCQTNWALMYGHDFRNCFYEDYLCAKQMTFEKFKERIDDFI